MVTSYAKIAPFGFIIGPYPPSPSIGGRKDWHQSRSKNVGNLLAKMNSQQNGHQKQEENDILEARFRLQIFAILRSPDSLRKLLNADGQQCSILRLDLGRFLAAYFLNFNFATFFANFDKISPFPSSKGCILPNLLLWAEFDEKWLNSNEFVKKEGKSQANRAIWERRQLGQILSAECSPTLALRILLKEGRILEAIFLADHFNDSRTALALRFFADRTFCLNLFSDFCHQILVEKLFEAIEMGNGNNFGQIDGENMDQNMEKFIQRQIEATLQVDILFGDQFDVYKNGLLGELMDGCAEMMAAEFGKFFDGQHFGSGVENDDDNFGRILGHNVAKYLFPLLPRPPIYSPPLSDELPCDSESLAWIKMHHCYLALSLILGRTNRLDQLIGFFALWLARSQDQNGESDLSLLVESDFFAGQNDEEIRSDLNAIQTMFSIVLGMELRDRIARMIAEGIDEKEDEEYKKCEAKLMTLSGQFHKQGEENYGLIWWSLKRWAQMADKSDLDSAALFLHHLQQRNQPNRRFLPPFNTINRPKWYSLLLSEDLSVKESTPINEDINNPPIDLHISEEQKFKLTRPDILRLRYLARHFPSVNLSPPLVQILLAWEPDEFCVELNPIDEGIIQMPKGNENDQLMAVLTKSKIKLPLLGGLMGGNMAKNEMEKKNEELEEMDDLEVLAEQIRASIRRLELLEIEQKAEDEKERMAEERAQFEMESSSNSNLPTAKSMKKMGRQPWNEGGESSEQSSTRIDQDRTYAAFLRSRLARRWDNENDSEFSASTSRPISSSLTGRTFSSSRRDENEEENSEKESAFESMEEENWAMEGNEGIKDELLKKEMNKIGQKLEWIRAQFGMKKDGEGMENEVKETNLEKEEAAENEGKTKEMPEEEIRWIEEEEEKEEDGKKEEIPIEMKSERKLSKLDANGTIGMEKSLKEASGRISRTMYENERMESPEIESVRVPSSAGYHSSLSSIGKNTHRIEAKKQSVGDLNKGKEEEQWKGRPQIHVEPMDFRGLRSSESEEEDEGRMPLGQKYATKKQRKLKKWTEIEVFPRNSPTAVENQHIQTSANKKTQNTGKRHKQPAKKQWKPPNWLRLLPPFDGAIRTERRMGLTATNTVAKERPLLQLRLEGLETLSAAGGIGTPRRTYLDMAKKEAASRASRKTKKNEKAKLEKELLKNDQNHGKYTGEVGVYDSGIGLDQTNIPSAGGGVVLYSTELGADEIEEMRKNARKL